MRKTSFRLHSGIILLFALCLGACSETMIEEPVEKTPETRGLTARLDGVYEESRLGGTLTGPTLESGDVLYTDKSYSFSYTPAGEIRPGSQWTGTSIGIRKVGAGNFDPEYNNTSAGMESKIINMNYTFSEPGQYELKGNKTYFWYSGTTLLRHTEGQIYASRKYTVISASIKNIRLKGLEEPIEIGKTYRLHVTFDDPGPGTKPVFAITIVDKLFGNKAEITTVDATSWDVVFTQPGEYVITARPDWNNVTQGSLAVSVYSREITIEKFLYVVFGNSKKTHGFKAFYYTGSNLDPEFKFTIIEPEIAPSDNPFIKPITNYSTVQVEKNEITYSFYTKGNYILRVELVGSPAISRDFPLTINHVTSPFDPAGPSIPIDKDIRN